MYATCATVGCVNSSTLIEVPGGADSVACGPCGNPINDVSDVAPEPATEVPEWLL